MTPVIQSILDQDMYKISMLSAVLKLYDDVDFEANFINRDNREFPPGFADAVKEQIATMADLSLTSEEEKWLRTSPFLKWLPRSTVDFLKGYRYDPSEVCIFQVGTQLYLSIRGPWYRAIMWEVPLMATISELYFKLTDQKPDWVLFEKNLLKKVDIFNKNDCIVTDFGTRRRYSSLIQNLVVNQFSIHGKTFAGTSNMDLARRYDVRPIGTVAHEMYQFHMALNGVMAANKATHDAWLKVYRGNLGTALTDTFTSDVFLRDFDKLYAMQFDSVRHDSGSPYEWGDKFIKHYQSLGIDPMSKTLIFSDGLTPEAAIAIKNYFKDRTKVAFGIGTNLTNDVGVKPLNIVIKASAFTIGGVLREVVKLSDVKEKNSGDKDLIKNVRYMLNID